MHLLFTITLFFMVGFELDNCLCQQVVPTACASQTFNISSDQNFYDDGGQGGQLCSDGDANNFCNCNCETTTSICVPTGQFLRVDFSVFAMFNTTSAFDWMKIYDGSNTSATVLFSNDVGGADHFPHGGSGSGYGDCGDDVPPVGFCSSGQCLTFEFHASGVVNRAGWEAALRIVNAGCVLLPLQLLSFDISASPHHIDVHWTVANESVQDSYQIERSEDGINWSTIYTTKALGDQQIVIKRSYKDLSPLSGLSYYRLKQVDFNGTSNYSSIKVVERTATELRLQIHPNPSQGWLQVSAQNIGSIRLFDMMGQERTHAIDINYLSPQRARLDCRLLSEGIYILKTSSGTRKIRLMP